MPSDVAAAAPAALPRALTEGPPATAPSLRPLGEAVTLTVLVGRAGISIVY